MRDYTSPDFEYNLFKHDEEFEILAFRNDHNFSANNMVAFLATADRSEMKAFVAAQIALNHTVEVLTYRQSMYVEPVGDIIRPENYRERVKKYGTYWF